MKNAYKIKNIENFKKELLILDFIHLEIIEDTGEFLAMDKRVNKRWDKFLCKGWLFQVLQDIKTDDFWLCFEECNHFKSLDFEEIICVLKIMINNTEN